MRIVLKRWKIVYIVGGYATLCVIARITDPLPLPVYYAIDFSVWFVYLLVAVRAFRGRTEPVEAPRTWWRTTSRPKAGFWLAALFGLSSLTFLLPKYAASVDGYATGYVLELGIFALFYLNSSIQLVRRGTARDEAKTAE